MSKVKQKKESVWSSDVEGIQSGEGLTPKENERVNMALREVDQEKALANSRKTSLDDQASSWRECPVCAVHRYDSNRYARCVQCNRRLFAIWKQKQYQAKDIKAQLEREAERLVEEGEGYKF